MDQAENDKSQCKEYMEDGYIEDLLQHIKQSTKLPEQDTTNDPEPM